MIADDELLWLEGDNSDPEAMGQMTPEVAAWTDDQNARTRAFLDHLPGRSMLEAALRPLMEIGAVSAPIARGTRYFYSRREGSQDQPVIYWRDGVHGPDRELIDPALIDPSGLLTVEWISPSFDGRLLAYGTYRKGDENTTLRVMDVDTGAHLPVEIPDKTQAPDWLPDGSGFVYHNLARADDPYSGRICVRRFDRPAADPVLFRQFTREENETLSTTWGPFATLSRDGRWLVLGYWTDTRSNDLWVADFDRYLRTGVLDRTLVTAGASGQAVGTVIDGTLFMRTTQGSPRGRIVAAPATDPARANWRDIVPERDDAVIESVSFAKGLIAVTYLRNASNHVDVFDLTGRSLGTVRQPGIGSASITTAGDRTEAFLTFTSFNHPTAIFRVDLRHPDAALELWQQPDVPVDPARVDVNQVWYRSKDGTRVSMFVVHRTGLVRDGCAPTILNGYGGFNISETPMFLPTLFPWLEAGGVFALSNLRGGGEYGDSWHEAGMLERKQNVFDDFIAAAEWLIANRYTSSNRLAVTGGSNGGLLTGAIVTQRPELVRAAIIAVPLLDMLRYQHFLMARYWVPEYGSAENPEHAMFLRAYSPYHNVSPGVCYPGVLLTAGEHDTRVHAMHARKMAARLQAATSGDPRERPILLWVDRDAGHGQGKPLHLRLRDAVDQRLFLMHQLGVITRDHHEDVEKREGTVFLPVPSGLHGDPL